VKIKLCALAAFIFLAIPSAVASAQEPQPPKARIPSMSNDDMGSRPARSEDVGPAATTGAPSGDWEAVHAAMGRITSFRARVINALPNLQSEVTLEITFPDRFHASVAGQVEIIGVGANIYVKPAGQRWMRSSEVDSRAMRFGDSIKEAFANIRSARLVGTETLDGVAMNIFEVSSVEKDGRTVRERIWVGKSDSLPRKIEQHQNSGPTPTFFFYDYNAAISIEEPAV
jgi:hypothetical protein